MPPVTHRYRSRYRQEAGRPVVDVRLASLETLFDNRDPSPFRDRDLDPGLVEFLVESAEDVLSRGPPLLVFWMEKPCEPAAVDQAVRAHFGYELERLERRRTRERRAGYLGLFIGVLLISALMSISQLVGLLVKGTFGEAITESLGIAGWVLLWHPVEVLVYDGLPWRRERRVVRHLIAAPLEVRAGKGPPAA